MYGMALFMQLSGANKRSIKYLRPSQVITGCCAYAWLGILKSDDTDS